MNRHCRRHSAGAALLLVVLALAALLGVSALTIDIGLMELARQRAQNDADAAALAGAGAPGSEGGTAASVAAANSAGGTLFRGVTTSVSADGSVTVRGYVNAPLSFAPMVGYAPQSREGAADTLSVPAHATAAMQNVCGLPPGMPVAPFGLIGDDPTNTDPAVAFVSALLSGAKTLTPGAYQPASTKVTLKLNVWDTTGKLVQPGSFDPLLTSALGATYFDTIRQVSDQALSAAQPLVTPPISYDNVASTRQYVAARLSPSNTAYSHAYATYDGWFNAGSPILPDGMHPLDRLMFLPVVSQAAKNKPGSITIIAFAVFFVDTPYPSGTAANPIVQGRFLGLTVAGGSGGTCAGAGGKTPPRLVP